MNESTRRWPVAFGLAAISASVLFRLAQYHTLWVEESYGLAAAQQLLAGRALYRDIWFDKPPLYAEIGRASCRERV